MVSNMQTHKLTSHDWRMGTPHQIGQDYLGCSASSHSTLVFFAIFTLACFLATDCMTKSDPVHQKRFYACYVDGLLISCQHQSSTHYQPPFVTTTLEKQLAQHGRVIFTCRAVQRPVLRRTTCSRPNQYSPEPPHFLNSPVLYSYM